MSMATNPKQNLSKASRRPGGGWEDDTDEPQLQPQLRYGDNKIRDQGNQNNSLAMKVPTESQKAKAVNTSTFKIEECHDDFVRANEYENKVVNDIIQPGGARVKQPDTTLNDFCTTCEHLTPNVIGSLLLSKFDEQIAWISKARVIFAIEILSKKLSKYFDYFKHNIQTLQKVSFTQEGMNANQLRKLMDSLMHILNHSTFSSELQKENQLFSKPTGPALPHNNSHGNSKPKTETTPGLVLTAKASSLPASIQQVSKTAKPESPSPFSVKLNTIKEATSPSNNTSLNSQQTPSKIENSKKSAQINTITPSKPSNENILSANSSQKDPNSNLKIPLEQGNSLVDSLSDIDFSKSPNNVYDLYKGQSPMGFYGAVSPVNYGPSYMSGLSPAFYNYPVNNQAQGGFNTYVQGNIGMHQNNNNNFAGHQNSNNGQKNEEDDIFNQAPEIDYDKEEKEKQKKREQIEKQFESLNF